MSGRTEVDAELVLLREADPAVDDDDVVAVLEQEHVAADLGEPAEEDQFDWLWLCYVEFLSLHRWLVQKEFHLLGRGIRRVGERRLLEVALASARIAGSLAKSASIRPRKRLLVQGGGGVVHRHDQPLAIPLRVAMDLGDPLTRKPPGHREPAEGDDDLRVDQGDLPVEVGRAGGDLVGERVAVTRRAALHHVCDEDVLAGDRGDRQQLVEELAGRTNKGLTLLVLVPAGAFPDEEDASLSGPVARDGVRPRPGELGRAGRREPPPLPHRVSRLTLSTS
jgi:hypothetical protein